MDLLEFSWQKVTLLQGDRRQRLAESGSSTKPSKKSIDNMTNFGEVLFVELSFPEPRQQLLKAHIAEINF